jgi:glycerol kinase
MGLLNLVLMRRALLPIERLRDFVREVGPLRPGQRAPAPGRESEATELAGAFNEMLDVGRREWDGELCELLGVAPASLPEPRPSAEVALARLQRRRLPDASLHRPRVAQADVLGVPVVVPEVSETTALGAAYLAAVATGAWSESEVRSMWRQAARYEPSMSTDERESPLAGWARALERAAGNEAGRSG